MVPRGVWRVEVGHDVLKWDVQAVEKHEVAARQTREPLAQPVLHHVAPDVQGARGGEGALLRHELRGHGGDVVPIGQWRHVGGGALQHGYIRTSFMQSGQQRHGCGAGADDDAFLPRHVQVLRPVLWVDEGAVEALHARDFRREPTVMFVVSGGKMQVLCPHGVFSQGHILGCVAFGDWLAITAGQHGYFPQACRGIKVRALHPGV